MVRYAEGTVGYGEESFPGPGWDRRGFPNDAQTLALFQTDRGAKLAATSGHKMRISLTNVLADSLQSIKIKSRPCLPISSRLMISNLKKGNAVRAIIALPTCVSPEMRM